MPYYTREDRTNLIIVVLFFVIMIGIATYWALAWRRCHARGDDWVLLKDAIGAPVCVNAVGVRAIK